MATLGLAGQAVGGLTEGDLPGPAWLGAPLAYAALGTKAGRRYLVPELGANGFNRAQVEAAKRLRAQGVKGLAERAGARAGTLSLTEMLRDEE
jgi:hypothetical protein